MIAHFQSIGYPPEYLYAVDIVPNTMGNIRAATSVIQPAATAVLAAAATAALNAGYEGETPQQLDIVCHSMGAVSTRWYAARLEPERVNTWLSLAGANHGTNALCPYDHEGARDMCPSFATSATDSLVQVELNGPPTAPIDESPYGLGDDRTEVTSIPPDSTRSILYFTVWIDPDQWIKPESSALIDGAGGVLVSVPSGVSVEEPTPGNYRYTGGDVNHDNLPKNSDVIRFVAALLGTRERFLWGDLNADSVEGAVDAGLLLRYDALLIDSFPGYPEVLRPGFPPAADLNDDGVAGALDAGLLLQYDAFLISSFPADFNQDRYGPEYEIAGAGKTSSKKTRLAPHELLSDLSSPGRKLIVSVERLASKEGSKPSWQLNLSIDNAKDLQTLRFGLCYNSNKIVPDEGSIRWLVSDAHSQLVTNTRKEDVLIVSAALSQPLAAGPTDLMALQFAACDTTIEGRSAIPVTLDRSCTRINDGWIPIHSDNVTEVNLSVNTEISGWEVHH